MRVGLNIDCFHGYESHTWLYIEIIHIGDVFKKATSGAGDAARGQALAQHVHSPGVFPKPGGKKRPNANSNVRSTMKLDFFVCFNSVCVGGR